LFEQVDELLKARSGAAQALVQDLASSELDSFRAFTTVDYYTTTVDQMTQCLRHIQAANKAGSAPAPDTGLLQWLGMPNPLVGSQPTSANSFTLCRQAARGHCELEAADFLRGRSTELCVGSRTAHVDVSAVMSGMRLHAILRCSAVRRELRLQLGLSYALDTMAAVSLALPWPAGVSQADAGRKGRGAGRPAHRAAC